MKAHMFSEKFTTIFTTVGMTTDCSHRTIGTDVDTKPFREVQLQVAKVLPRRPPATKWGTHEQKSEKRDNKTERDKIEQSKEDCIEQHRVS